MRTLPFAILAVTVFGAGPVLAQGTADALSGRNTRPQIPRAQSNDEKNRPLPAPDAVPGARARTDSVAPVDRSNTDMPPTEALFDSINRGDLSTAKDAIARGADLDGTNVLGLTPLELSVDLGRNDISFLLLSMRGASPNRGPSQANAAPPTPAQRRLAERQAAAQARAEAATQKRALAATAKEAPSTRQGPALFAGDGGTPVPQAGFLGFGNQR